MRRRTRALRAQDREPRALEVRWQVATGVDHVVRRWGAARVGRPRSLRLRAGPAGPASGRSGTLDSDVRTRPACSRWFPCHMTMTRSMSRGTRLRRPSSLFRPPRRSARARGARAPWGVRPRRRPALVQVWARGHLRRPEPSGRLPGAHRRLSPGLRWVSPHRRPFAAPSRRPEASARRLRPAGSRGRLRPMPGGRPPAVHRLPSRSRLPGLAPVRRVGVSRGSSRRWSGSCSSVH